jgi:hypothetical protein
MRAVAARFQDSGGLAAAGDLPLLARLADTFDALDGDAGPDRLAGAVRGALGQEPAEVAASERYASERGILDDCLLALKLAGPPAGRTVTPLLRLAGPATSWTGSPPATRPWPGPVR